MSETGIVSIVVTAAFLTGAFMGGFGMWWAVVLPYKKAYERVKKSREATDGVV